MNNNISLYAPINHLGYGVVSFNVWKYLKEHLSLTLYPIGNRIDVASFEEDAAGIEKSLFWNCQKATKPNDPCLKIYHENHLYERIGCGKYLAYPFFELDVFNTNTINSLSQCDHILAPSTWAKTVLENHNFNNVSVVPCGVNRRTFNPQHSTTNYKKCVFFNCGKWEVRKGHDVLINMFRAAFGEQRDVQLIVMSDNPFLSDEQQKYWKDQYIYNNVSLLNRVKTQKELAYIMGSTFCGIFPARAEGWNLELLEMMSMGKFTIATNYAGHTEFINDKNCYPIPIDKLETAFDGIWFKSGVGSWAKIDQNAFDYAVNAMREVYRIWKDNPESNNGAGMDTANKFSWSNTVGEIIKCLN